MSSDPTLRLDPSAVPHPGVTVSDYLVAARWPRAELARRTMLPIEIVDDICDGRASITAEVAPLIARALGRPAAFWLKLQERYDEAQSVQHALHAQHAAIIAMPSDIEAGNRPADERELKRIARFALHHLAAGFARTTLSTRLLHGIVLELIALRPDVSGGDVQPNPIASPAHHAEIVDAVYLAAALACGAHKLADGTFAGEGHEFARQVAAAAEEELVARGVLPVPGKVTP